MSLIPVEQRTQCQKCGVTHKLTETRDECLKSPAMRITQTSDLYQADNDYLNIAKKEIDWNDPEVEEIVDQCLFDIAEASQNEYDIKSIDVLESQTYQESQQFQDRFDEIKQKK